MKAIIIAAGMGNRMHGITADMPKCLLEFNGKPLLQIQMEILRSLGIRDISIIKGYKQEKIDFHGVKYYLNEDYANNNILESLFCAEPEINGDAIIHYCDIIYEKQVAEKLLACPNDISIVVDVNWKANYEDRQAHPLSEAENVDFDDRLMVRKIGKIMDGEKTSVPGEFIGMLKLSGKGADTFKRMYHASRGKYKDRPFQKAKSIKKAYITDMIQELVDNSIPVKCVAIHNGWQEIDTVEDFNKAIRVWEKMIV